MLSFKLVFSLSFFTFIKRFLGYSLLSAIRMMSSACCCCCPTLCDPIDSSLPGSSIPGILQARTLEWVAISFSNAWKWKVKVKSLSHVWLSDPMDCSLPGFSIHGIFQARGLEWGAIAFSVTLHRPSIYFIVVLLLSRIWLFGTLWIAAQQASLSFTIFRSLLKLMFIESVMPCNHLFLCRPLFLLPSIFLSIRVFFQWVSSSHQVAIVLELQLQHQSFQWVFRVDFL